MSYNTQRLLRDVEGNPIPQRFNPNTNQYEPADNTIEINNFPSVQGVKVEGTLMEFQPATITVGSTPVELTAGLINRKQLIVYPPESGTIYWGKSNVTVASGLPHKHTDQPLDFLFGNPTLKVYAISDTPISIRVVESK